MKYIPLTILVTLLSYFAHADQLKSVIAIVNHGDTIPSQFYPNDPYKDSPIWNDLGQLSTLGERQSFAVGQWFLKRYIHKNPFVSLHYNASQIYAFSEDRDESLMSAECILAGFLPPVGDEIWNKKLLWRPIPVHTVPLFLDFAIGRGVNCPRYAKKHLELLHGRFYRTHNKKAKDLLAYLSAQTGQKFVSIWQIPSLYTILEVEQNHNLTLPNWTHSVYPEALGKIILDDSTFSTKNPELAMFSIGPLFGEIGKTFQAILENLGTVRKFNIYVANNSLIYDTLHALKVPPVGVVPFSATLIFELWESNTGLSYVKLLYRNSPALHTPIQTLRIGGCKSNKCPYQTFNAALNKVAINFTKWDELCNTPKSSSESSINKKSVQLNV